MDQNLESIGILLSKNMDQKQDEKLLQPYAHVSQVTGNKVREVFMKVFNYWLNIPEHILAEIMDIFTVLQNACLLLDDIQDNSKLRRGMPSAHILYGVPATVNAACYMMFKAFQRSSELAYSHQDTTFPVELLAMDVFRGQGMDIYWRENFICPTEEEYCQMAMRKTGTIFAYHLKLMQVFSENKYDFTKLTSLVGLYFQIRDDYMNLHSPDVGKAHLQDAMCITRKLFQYHKLKTFCEDITEGKFSYPVVHAINSHPDDGEILGILKRHYYLEILKMRTTDVKLKKRFICLLEEYGSLDRTRAKMNYIRTKIGNEIMALEDNPYLSNLINEGFSVKQF